MVSDAIEGFQAIKEIRKEQRQRLGVDCPGCKIRFPKTNPSKLMPGWRCRACGHVDPRPRCDDLI